ncbi:MAG: hypothetical protein ACI9JN_001790 [Bacteroidia bacterium]|jgi:hypothetical protein
MVIIFYKQHKSRKRLGTLDEKFNIKILILIRTDQSMMVRLGSFSGEIWFEILGSKLVFNDHWFVGLGFLRIDKLNVNKRLFTS